MNVKDILLENERLTEENKTLRERNAKLERKFANLTLWDLSPEAQEAARHALAKDLSGR